jgi:hypothetical protein
MTGLPKLVCAGLLLAFLCAVIAARAWTSEIFLPAAVHSPTRDRGPGADPDYVEGLVKLGIVSRPNYGTSAARSH